MPAAPLAPLIMRRGVIEAEAMAELMDRHSQIVRRRGREIGGVAHRKLQRRTR